MMNIGEKIIRAKIDYDEVHEAGKQAEYDRFWDNFQQNGDRVNYNSQFSGRGWSEKTFFPKYPIIVSGSGACAYIFSMSGFKDFKKHIQENGIVIDLSQATGQAVNLFGNSSFLTHVPEINISGCNNLQYGFTNCNNLVSIDKLTVSSAMTFSSSFANCSKLENITFAGEIGKSIDFQYSPLTKASIESIVEHLWDGASGQKLTLNLAAVNKAFETIEGANDGSTSAEWTALKATKPNWGFAYA